MLLLKEKCTVVRNKNFEARKIRKISFTNTLALQWNG